MFWKEVYSLQSRPNSAFFARTLSILREPIMLADAMNKAIAAKNISETTAQIVSLFKRTR